MKGGAKRKFFLAALSATAFCAASSTVWAGNWTSTFDPIGLSGTDLLNVSGSDCLPGSSLLGGAINFFYVNGFGDNNCTATLLNATVTLTSTDPSATTQLSFGPSGAIWGLDIGADGTLLGVDSFLIGPSFAPEGANPVFSGPWWIELSAQDGQTPPLDPPPSSVDNIVNLFGGSCFEGCFPDQTPTDTASVIGNVFVPVPEPGSLALLVAAAGAGLLARRRKARS